MFYFHCCSSAPTLRNEVGLCRWGHQDDRACIREECFQVLHPCFFRGLGKLGSIRRVFNFVLRYGEWVITFIHRDSSIAEPEWHPWHQIPNKVSTAVLARQVIWVTVNHQMSWMSYMKEWVISYWERGVHKNYHVYHEKNRNLRSCLVS